MFDRIRCIIVLRVINSVQYNSSPKTIDQCPMLTSSSNRIPSVVGKGLGYPGGEDIKSMAGHILKCGLKGY